MLRRSTQCLKVDVSKWSPELVAQMAIMSKGSCFDTTVLNDSPMPTKHLQKSLFRLPIPKLEDTCKRYKDSVQPIVSDEQFKKTTAIVDAFVAGEGKTTHEALVAKDKANPHTSYISADWFDLYLRDRSPLPINYNPALVTREDTDKKDGLVRAAFWTASTCRWYKKYLDNTLKPEVFYFGPQSHYSRQDWFQRFVGWTPESISAKVLAIGSQFMAFPLDMSQYDNLFCSTRLPGAELDEVKAFGFHPHIVVNYRGHQFKVTVADANCNPLPEAQIYARLKAIVDTNVAPAVTDVGALTALNRTEWAAARGNMIRKPANIQSLADVDRAIFILDLDVDTNINFDSQPASVAANRHFIASERNRWWDKAVSVIVSKEGALGVNFEHAWGDGVAVLRYTVDTFNDSISRSAATMSKSDAPSEPVQQLAWDLDPEVKKAAEKGLAELTATLGNMDYSIGINTAIGKRNKIFKGIVKPDPFMQMAMQLAWFRLNNSTVSTYESASTAAFLKGRTECIRSATMESKAFAAAFDNNKVSDAEKLQLLVAACTKHAAISKDAKMGSGIDRHMFALRKQFERNNGGKTADIFADPSYSTFGSNMISTSSLFSDALVGGGFGPVSPGYGVGYASADNLMLFSISSWKKGGPKDSAEAFAGAIHEAAGDMAALLASNPAATAKSK